MTILYTTTLIHYDQWVWHRPFSLILTIWLSNVVSTPLVYLPVLLTKWGLKPIIMLFVWKVGYMPLNPQCNHIMAKIYQSNSAMSFVVTTYLTL